MKKLMFMLLFAAAASAQVPMRQGAVLEYAYTDSKGKELRDEWRNTRFLRMTVDQVWGDSVANVHIDNENFTRLNKHEAIEEFIGDLQWGDVLRTADGWSLENMQWMVSPLMSMFRMLGNDIAPDETHNRDVMFRPTLTASSYLPRELHVGDSLPDEQVKVVWEQVLSDEAQREMDARLEEINSRMAERGMGSMPKKFDFVISASITDRRVVGFEKVKTPAGEFECWKIAYNLVGPKEGIAGMPDFSTFLDGMDGGGAHMTTRMGGGGGTLVTPCVDYISLEVGLVRRERMNDSGKKIAEIMELRSIRN